MKVADYIKPFAANQKFEIRKTEDAMDCYFSGTLMDYNNELSDMDIDVVTAEDNVITILVI